MSVSLSTDDLAGYLGAELANDLRAMARMRPIRFRVPARPRRPVTGYTGAVLATLLMEEAGATYQVMMKASPRDSESHQYLQAWNEGHDFAKRHLIRLRDPPGPWPMSGGGVILFQDLAADGAECRPLSELPGDDLPGAYRTIVTALLTDWNHAELGVKRQAVSHFLQDQIGPAALSGGSVRRWAEATSMVDRTTQWIMTVEDGAVWPNPVAIVFGRSSPMAGAPIDCLVGHGHGDLHLENVLLPVGRDGRADPARFTMIDLATYSPAAPLTSDVVYLMLSTIALRLPYLPEESQTALLHRVVAPGAPAGTDPAFQVVGVLEEVGSAAIRRRDQGWTGNWRPQYLLSTLALALLFTTYERLGADHRWWFFRLAARAGRQLMATEPPLGQPAALLANPFRESGEPPPPTPVRPPDGPVEPAGSGSARPARRRQFRLTARAWQLAGAGEAADARSLLWQAGKEIATQPADAAARAMGDLLSDAIHIIGTDDELTLKLRYELARQTSLVAGRAADARRLFGVAATECERVLGRTNPLTRQCRRAQHATSLVRRAETGG